MLPQQCATLLQGQDGRAASTIRFRILDAFVELTSRIDTRIERMKWLRHEDDISNIVTLKKRLVVFTTSYLAAKYNPLQRLPLTILVLDEAALIPSAYDMLLYSIPTLKSIVLISDHHQMGPSVQQNWLAGEPWFLGKSHLQLLLEGGLANVVLSEDVLSIDFGTRGHMNERAAQLVKDTEKAIFNGEEAVLVLGIVKFLLAHGEGLAA
jgi:hypothetical protein